MRRVDVLRAQVAVVLSTLGAIATAVVTACLLPEGHALPLASELIAIAAITLAGAAIAMLARSARLASAEQAGALRKRALAERRKSQGAVYQRQRNPAAAGRARPRAPSAALAAA
ncbi:MAG TPA: DUF6412 domain-containing protein [Streptosporangiaceae bacterium]|nr:DUF6412 domain-containing protein [Streptosporangiaceae bacterium]